MIAQTTRTLHSTGRLFGSALHFRTAGVLPGAIRLLAVTLIVAALAPLSGRPARAAGGGDRVNVTALDCPSWPVGTPVDALQCDYFPNLGFWIKTSEESINTTTNDMGAASWSGNTTYVWVEETVPVGYRVEIYCGLYQIVLANGEYQYQPIGDLLDNGDGSTSTTIDADQAQAVNCTFYNILLEPFGGRAVEFDDDVLANGVSDDPGYAGFDDDVLANGVATTVSVDVHSCPDDFTGDGFSQYQTACTSDQGVDGVNLALRDGNGSESVLFAQVDGTGGAAPLVWSNIAPGGIEISEVSGNRLRESVVFCSLRSASNVPGALDGADIPVLDGSITGYLNPGDELTCDWYRFPGGVVAAPADDEAAGQGGTIEISKRICPAPLTDSGVLTGSAERDLDAYLAACESAKDGVKFTLTTNDGETSRDTVDGRVAWDALVVGDYTIAEVIPAGYGDPVVFCEGNVPGRQYVRRNLVQHDASGGYIAFSLEQDEVVTCDWFNISTGGTDPSADTDREDNQTDGETTTDPETRDDGGWNEDADRDSQNDNGGTIDSDGDGLTDSEEVEQIGTDPYNNDSDLDGLYDWDELNVYFTDPLNADTDGDGFVDGEEIYYGSNPLDPDA